MRPQLTLITLGVSDIARSQAYYEAIGWTLSSASGGDVRFFHSSGAVLALHPTDALATDAGVPSERGRFDGITLAHNVASREEVDAMIARCIDAGARPMHPAKQREWGGYTGYVADPDGHLWEIAWNPFFPLDERGLIRLPE